MSFLYDDAGLRTEKVVDGTTVTYTWSGSTLLSESTDSYILLYLYDESASPIGFQYKTATKTETYFYEKNIQGDIVAVYNESGTKLISYVYDAWGNANISFHNGGENTNATRNPFTYRGYCFDQDLGLYYLQSRYYDAKVGRFISADEIAVITASPTALTDKNLYAYCDNNPITRGDGDGEFWNYIIGGIVGAIAGGVVSALNGGDTKDIIIGVFSGALSGVVAASPLGWLAQAAISAGISAVADATSQTVDIIQSRGTICDYNFYKTVDEACAGFLTSAAGSGLGFLTNKFFTGFEKKADVLFDKYLEKTFTAGLRREVGKSTSSLMRQANNFLKQSTRYLNMSRGVSSVVGSVISFWNVAR